MTREVLQMRGCNVNQECVLCEGGSIETRDHMFWGCSYSTGFWIALLAQLNLPTPAGISIEEVWFGHRDSLDKLARQRWDLTWATGTWALWRERNKRILIKASRALPMLINNAATEIHFWLHEGYSRNPEAQNM